MLVKIDNIVFAAIQMHNDANVMETYTVNDNTYFYANKMHQWLTFILNDKTC